MPATACRAKSNFAMIGTASHGWHGHHAAQYLWLFNRRLLNTFIEYSYIEYYTHTMSNVTASANIWVPTQPLVEAFSDATHEAFHEYLRRKPNRFRFTDEKYDLFRWFLAQKEDSSRETSPVLSEYFEKDKKRWAKILVLHDFCLDDENRILIRGWM